MSMAFVVFRISPLKIRYDLSRGRVGRSVSWSLFKRLEQLKKNSIVLLLPHQIKIG